MFIQTNSFVIFTCLNPVLASGKWVSMKTDLYKMVYIYVVERYLFIYTFILQFVLLWLVTLLTYYSLILNYRYMIDNGMNQ